MRRPGTAPTPAQLAGELPYLDMVVDEVLRLYPPAWGISRQALGDDTLGGFPIRRGWLALVVPYVLHRLPAFWKNPDTFDPDRFLPERSADRPKFVYLPFGAGPRQCIGNHFALMEAQLILVTLAQRYRLRLVPGHPTKWQAYAHPPEVYASVKTLAHSFLPNAELLVAGYLDWEIRPGEMQEARRRHLHRRVHPVVEWERETAGKRVVEIAAVRPPVLRRSCQGVGTRRLNRRQVIGRAGIRRTRIIGPRLAQQVRRRSPRIPMIDRRRAWRQVEVIINPAVVSGPCRVVTQDLVRALYVDELGIGGNLCVNQDAFVRVILVPIVTGQVLVIPTELSRFEIQREG